MFKWLTGLFKDDRCKCRGCQVARKGCGYAPCSNVKGPLPRPTKQPPRKL